MCRKLREINMFGREVEVATWQHHVKIKRAHSCTVSAGLIKKV